MRLTIPIAALGLVAVAIAGMSLGASSASADTVTIDTGNFYFCSSAQSGKVCATSVHVGDTVQWTVISGSHQVQQCDDNTFTTCTGFDLGLFSVGDNRSHTFTTAGDIYYHCELHTNMKGQIKVEAPATNTPSPSPSPTPAPTATASPTATPKAVPQTGGPADGNANAWKYALLLVGGMLVAGSAATFVAARKW